MTNYQENSQEQSSLFSRPLPGSHAVYLLFWSGVLTLVSAVVLFFPQLASSLQSHQVYVGWAMSQGQLPYLDLYSQSGLLTNSLMGIAAHFGGLFWFLPVQFICFYVSGHYLEKLVYALTGQVGQALTTAVLFYLCQLVFGFGGGYSIQLAVPFILIGLWFFLLVSYDKMTDERLLLYGLVAVLGLGFAPQTLLFWCLTTFSLLWVSCRQQGLGRGFYRLLCVIFGGLLLLYPLAYLVLSLEVLQPLLEQGLAALQPFGFSLEAAGFQLVALLCSGLLTGFLFLPRLFGKMAEQKPFLVLLSLNLVVYSGIAVLSQSLQLSELLPAVPFGLLLTALLLAPKPSEDQPLSRRQKKTRQPAGFLRQHAYLPLLVGVAGLVWAVLPFVSSQGTQEDRGEIVRYLQKETSADDFIVAWDDSAQLYLASERLSATQFPVVTVYTNRPSNQQLLIDEVLQGTATVVVVNKSLDLPDTVKEELDGHYQLITLDGVSHFTLYYLK